MKNNKLGFTLIELLVVVLIIGILAAIALPMYNKAVLRSRFAALMPIVKAMNDSNEAYYLEHGRYVTNPEELPVQGKLEYPDGTELEFGPNMDYAYVSASNPAARNRYVMYQKHSGNYPGEIHCEAVTGDTLAEAICASYSNGEGIGTTLTDGYTTYIVQGTGAGFPVGAGNDNGAVVSCDAANAMGLTCNITTNEDGQQEKKICTGLGSNRYCRTKIYNEDGSYTSVSCEADSNNECTSQWRFATYDANGLKKSTRVCNSVDSNGNCTAYGGGTDYTYDANGNVLTQWSCSTSDSDGNCTAYGSGDYAGNYEYTYDANGNKLTERYCNTVDASTKTCAVHTNTGAYDYTYDANGNMLTRTGCSTVDSSTGNCTAYESRRTEYMYDADGKKLSDRVCNSVDGNGNCTSWGSGYDYKYDANGNKVATMYCSLSDSSSGNCTNYGATASSNATYDGNGKILTNRSCEKMDNSTGNCTKYRSGNYAGNYDYMYDENGNLTSQRTCSSVGSGGVCTLYYATTEYVYDDNGNQLVSQYCYGSTINTATGECITYNGPSVAMY